MEISVLKYLRCHRQRRLSPSRNLHLSRYLPQIENEVLKAVRNPLKLNVIVNQQMNTPLNHDRAKKSHGFLHRNLRRALRKPLAHHLSKYLRCAQQSSAHQASREVSS